MFVFENVNCLYNVFNVKNMLQSVKKKTMITVDKTTIKKNK